MGHAEFFYLFGIAPVVCGCTCLYSSELETNLFFLVGEGCVCVCVCVCAWGGGGVRVAVTVCL